MEAFHKIEDIHGRSSIRDEDDEDIGCPSSSSSSSSSSDSSNSHDSSSSDFMDDATTCFSCSSNSPTTSSAKGHVENPLFEMSALLDDLPIKRGLSRHFQGKSQSFTSLANAKSLEDLVKPVRTFNRKRNIKSCKSYGGGLDAHKSLSPRGITKKDRSFVGLRRNGFSMGRPPTHPYNSSGNLSSQAFLFAR